MTHRTASTSSPKVRRTRRWASAPSKSQIWHFTMPPSQGFEVREQDLLQMQGSEQTARTPEREQELPVVGRLDSPAFAAAHLPPRRASVGREGCHNVALAA